MKNGSFDLAFRTMTIGLLMFLVLSIVSVGIHNLRPGSSSQIGPVAGNAGQPAASSRTDEVRREFASSLARVSDRLAGIEQRFSTLNPPTVAGAPTAEDSRLQSAIESTQRRLENLGDRLTDRIQSISAGSEVELRDLNRQLSQLLNEQQQIQEQMVSVRVAAQNRLQPARMTRSKNQQDTEQPADRTARNRQERLTQNLEAMVNELASLREQLQSVRVAAANIEPEDERVAISRKIPGDGPSAEARHEPESPLDRIVPEPADLNVSPEPPAVTEPPAVDLNATEASSGDTGAELISPAESLDETIELPTADLPETSAIQTESSATIVSTEPAGGNWEVPVAARPVSTIFPVDRRPGSSTQTPRGKPLPATESPAKLQSNISAGASGQSSVRISLPAPAPLAATESKSSSSAPLPFPAAVAEITEPADSESSAGVSVQVPSVASTGLTPREPRRLGGDVPPTAQRAPLRLAEAPVVRPFEVPTRKPEPVAQKTLAGSKDEDSSNGDSALSRFALASSKSANKPVKSSRGVTNAKWRAARDDSEGDGARPALRDSRSLFPIFRGKSSNSDSPRNTEASSAADSRIPQPLPLPRNLIESSAIDRVSAPPLIDQVSAEVAGPARRFTVQASVLHITADDLTTVDRAGIKTLAVMGGHDFRVDQIRHAVRESEAADEIYSGAVTVSGGVPTRIPIGWLCPHCNEESGVANGDQLVVTLPHKAGDRSATFFVEQADGTGRSESFRDSRTMLIPGASVQITEAAQDGTVETSESESTPVLSRLPVIGEKFEKKSTERQIMQRIIVLTIRELRDSNPQKIQQLSGRSSATNPKVVHADLTAPVPQVGRQASRATDSSRATAANAGVANRRPAPPVED